MAKEKGENLILIGMTGTGKSGVGRLLARLLSYDFADTDEMIEEVCGYPLPEIARRYGKRRLLSEEELALKRLSEKEHCVIATGDSLPLNPKNSSLLQSLGFVVLLQGEPELIHHRIQRKKNRCLLGKNLDLPQITQIMLERYPIYEPLADASVAVDRRSMEEIAAAVLVAYQKNKEE
jgi:shikimate kinase